MPRVTSKKSSVAASEVPATPAVKTTPQRKSSVPPKAKASKLATTAAVKNGPPTYEMIAERAYHLWLSGAPGCEVDHWIAAERELNG